MSFWTADDFLCSLRSRFSYSLDTQPSNNGNDSSPMEDDDSDVFMQQMAAQFQKKHKQQNAKKAQQEQELFRNQDDVQMQALNSRLHDAQKKLDKSEIQAMMGLCEIEKEFDSIDRESKGRVAELQVRGLSFFLRL